MILFVLVLIFSLGIAAPPLRAYAADLNSKAGAVTTAAGSLNVRSSPTSSGAVATTLKKGSHITLLSQSGSWWRVEYGNGTYGWCHADYITPIEGTAVSVQLRSGSLNVRSGPGTSYGKNASLYPGQVVILLSTSGGWSRILYHGTKTGYVSSEYLTVGSAAVALSVPGFKQTDSRWAGTAIGTSGKTMAQIGCATTAIAMVESYRTGTTIYPDAMAKKLSYTSSGSVYWPGHYTAVTDSSGYLQGIYRKLRQGKPVLFGAKNSYGSQHWVVVTGYTGDGSLPSSGFTINDPGSNSRTTLEQFLSEYPIFYKYFCY